MLIVTTLVQLDTGAVFGGLGVLTPPALEEKKTTLTYGADAKTYI